MKKHRRYLPACIAAALLLGFTVFSARAKLAAAEAMRLCAVSLVPTLFPFYTAVNLFLRAGLPPAGAHLQALMRRCFRLPGEAAPALLLGLIGGYPIGASVTASLYRQGQVSRDEAIRLSMFTNNAGPGFILGAAGLTVFHSVRLGLLLLLIHVLSALAVGATVRSAPKGNPIIRRRVAQQATPLPQLLPEAISASLHSMLMICAYVVFCSVCLATVKALPLCSMLLQRLCGVFPAADAVFSGLAELSCGILSLRGLPVAEAFVVASFLLGWGGLCVFLQGAEALTAVGLPIRQCLSGKLLQAVYAGALACAVCGFTTRLLPFFLFFAVTSFCIAVLLKNRGRKNKYSLL